MTKLVIFDLDGVLIDSKDCASGNPKIALMLSSCGNFSKKF